MFFVHLSQQLVVLAEGKSLAVDLVGTGNADKGGGINALNHVHKIGVLTHGEGHRKNGLRLS